MKGANNKMLNAAVILAALVAGHAVAGGYGGAPYGGGYGPGAGYGAPYGGPLMALPPRPQRPEPPARPLPPEPPQMAPYSYGYPMGRAYMPGNYGMKPGYDMGRSYAATPAPATAPAKTVASLEGSEAPKVTIAQMRFDAPTVTIKAGGTVTWTNSEGVPHTVTADDGSFSSSRLSGGDSFSHTFNEPDTYTYYCQIHPMMRATVVVEA